MTVHVRSTGSNRHAIEWWADKNTKVSFNIALEYDLGPSLEIVQGANIRVRFDVIADKMISLLDREVNFIERDALIAEIAEQIPEFITLGGPNAI